MNRLLVALLAAVDALIAAAVGVAVVLAPLTVFWVLGLGGEADWAALWPAAVRIWQFGELVPLKITLPPEYLTATGVPTEAATFWLSLAPLAFAAFTAVFAARSGARAARAGAWMTGVGAGTVVTAVLVWLLWWTSPNPIAAVYGWQALLMPTLVFAVPALLGALTAAWRLGDDGLVDDIHVLVHRRLGWTGVVEASARGVAVAVAGFVGVGALVVAVATVLRGGEVIALFEAAHVDAAGATMIALGQLAYLPTLAIWGGAYAAGPGFAVGSGSAVSPAGTDLGVLPGIPVLGIIPADVSSWMLLSVLAIVAVGFAAGAAARVRLLGRRGDRRPGHEATAPRAIALAAIVVLGAAAAALLAAVASGSIGPGRLAETGPAPGPVALAVGVELLIGAAIALLTPARASHGDDDEHAARTDDARTRTATTAQDAAAPSWWDHDDTTAAPEGGIPSEADTEPLAASDLDPLETLPDGVDRPSGGGRA